MTIAARCLILACGNTLRSDDGIGPFLAAWAENRWRDDARVRVIWDHQWTPELAEEVVKAEAVIFVDCSLDQVPGQTLLRELSAEELRPGLVTHHISAAELLGVARSLYGRHPDRASLLTIGAGNIELGERFSDAVEKALPEAQRMLEQSVQRLLE